MDQSPNRPSVSPLSRARQQSEQSLRLQDLKYKEKLLQMDKINAKLQSQLDETLIELEKAHKNLQLQNQMKESQDNDYLRLVKENELLKGDLQFKQQENELNKQKVAQQSKQFQQSFESLKEQYEQLQQSLINKYVIETNTKLEEQKQQYENQNRIYQERLKDIEMLEKQAQEQLLEKKEQVQELLIRGNEQKSQIESQNRQLNTERQIIMDKEQVEQLLMKKIEQISIDNNRLIQEIENQKEKYNKLEKQYEESVSNIIKSKEKQAEEQTVKFYQQHEQSMASLSQQNQEIWKQLQDQKQINQVQQKEINRLTQLNQQYEQENKEKETKIKDLRSGQNSSSEQGIVLQQKLLQSEQALLLYKSQLDDFKATRNEFEQRIMERSKTILRQKEQEFLSAQQSNEQKIIELTQELEKIENESQQQQFKQLQDKLMNESTIKSLQIRIGGIEEQYNTIQQQLEETKQDLIDKQNQCENLNNQLNKEKTFNLTTLRIQKSQIQDLQQKLKEYQIEVDKLSGDVRERDDILESQRAQFMNEKNELEQQIRIIFEKLSSQKQRIQDLEETNYQQSNTISKLSSEKEKIEKELKQIQRVTSEQIKKQTEEINQLNLQIEEQSQTIQQHEEQLSNNETQIAELQTQLEEQFAQNQQLSKEVVELNDELEETRQDREAKIQEMDQWKRQFKQSNVPVADFEQVKKEAEQFKNKSMDQEQIINKLETAQQANSKEIYHLQDEIASLKQNYTDAQSQLVTKKKENDALSTELESLKREFQRTSNQLKEIEQRDQQNSETVIKQKREIQRLNDDMETKNRQLQNMEQQLNKKFDELAVKQRELEDIRKKYQQDALGRMTTSPSQKSVMMASQNLARSTAKGLTTKIPDQQN